MGCIDDPDISIRMQALELGASMVSSDNIVTVVERLMKQLRNAPSATSTIDNGRNHALGVEPAADSDGENPEETLRPSKEILNDVSPLSTEYRVSIIGRILDMCSKDTYTNILDFEWYVRTLLHLVKLLPSGSMAALGPFKSRGNSGHDPQESADDDILSAIGWELRNVAVRVSSVRPVAVHAADSLLVIQGSESSAAFTPMGRDGVLQFASWVVGEYADDLLDAHSTLTSLIHSRTHSLSPLIVSAYLQSVPKVLISLILNDGLLWNSERKTMVSLLLARIIHFLEPLATHPSLEVQERSVELLELMHVTLQAVAGHGLVNEYAPLLLTKAIPALFSGSDLNPVAPNAQEKVPQPQSLDLDTAINVNLRGLLQGIDEDNSRELDSADFEWFYCHRSNVKASTVAAFDAHHVEIGIVSYQETGSETLDPATITAKRIERHGRHRDDPFYIASDDPSSGVSTPLHDILRNTNGEDVDVDSIPIMNLELGDKGPGTHYSDVEIMKQQRMHPKKSHIVMDENIDLDQPAVNPIPENGGRTIDNSGSMTWKREKSKRALLEVDSSGLGGFSLEDDDYKAGKLDVERQEVEDSEMAKALEEVERLRLEMQRASELVRAADGVPPEGTLVKKKKKKKRKDNLPEEIAASQPQGITTDENGYDNVVAADTIQTMKPKKKKKKKKAMAPKHDSNDGTCNGQMAANAAAEGS